MNSAEAVGAVREAVGGDVAVVAGVGRAGWTAGQYWPERTLHLDALGDVLPVASGLALGLGPAGRVLSVEGDGSLLFGLAGLATLASLRGRLGGFTAVVLDNERYESGGNLPSRHFPLDWPALVGAFSLPFGQAYRPVEVAAALAASAPVGVVRLVVRDETPLPAPIGTNNGREAVHAYRRMLDLRYGVRPSVPARKF
ncbi:thiamine pyrophosphate-dependent enzyme [Plantactinospora soyae]|uniref:Thiamine pyrophosphate-dependent acetolactate synthase large subunit-like protein n=1 Tax=Plantactinospora soyae TaxID=1544732 RepID=A0A927M186_9ACTN|nr:thiamine pyrophosphate-dependent enzyme [Plantactinospora soyae]MBE1486303.1 thiamine pyrophosphate-dependent acetolactate synthase large subunit-like protein [Plantactinospora soyae]